MPIYHFDQNVFGQAMRNFPQLQRMAMERLKEQEKEREFNERQGATEEYRSKRLDFEERKEKALEGYRERLLGLSERAKDLEGLRVQTEMGKAEYEMEKEKAQARETLQQQQEMTKAVQELGKINIKKPDYLDKIADIRSRFPNAFKQSKNGEETFIHDFMRNIYQEREEYDKGVAQARERYGPNLAFGEGGDIDWKQTKLNESSGHAAVAKEAADKGLLPTGVTETSRGPSWRFGAGADGTTTTTQTQSTTPQGDTKIVTTKTKGAQPPATAGAISGALATPTGAATVAPTPAATPSPTGPIKLTFDPSTKSLLPK